MICMDDPDIIETYLMVPEMLWSSTESQCSCCEDAPEPPGAQGMQGSIKGEPTKEPIKGPIKENIIKRLQKLAGIK